ncbi:chromosome segregation protein SMC [Helcococcus kunzii]|uniref:Chromosome partition protein Smc n=3 Tax=Helcococcus kunzii TaxID=40091 RepID=H3NNG8_9FIRM|nr:chromosome segregation protein SMC [Helcococcus kunzii]EHR33943.1 chromosome segregation protein SMC [Helcococcus kunzii ATCC 51366]QUY64794.1 chromosome segregation protein SMC [Helcococcus kunzii]
MKLKHIELYGFKSFADKTKLQFDKDISAVVGPNGSGKSNIADAIKWVLGEQSAKSLRGTSMQDVIFSGSDSKKQMNMAQVSIVLDNSDKSLPIAFDEVNVTRRVFRTGDSEYLINKSPVRLKEIRELLLDTGIGKDGYSMIGQGRIDEILSGRNEDRREIFEEATGVSKNKYKKTESEKKLVKNEENLEKLNNELKVKQQEYNILKKQSENAKEGIKLTSRLEMLELNILQKAINKSSADLKNDKSKLEYINGELKEDREKFEVLNSKLKPINEEIEKKELKIEQLNSDKQSNLNKINSITNDINILNEKLKFYNSDIDRLKNSIEVNNKKIISLKNNIENKEKEIEKLIVKEKELKNSLSDLKKLNEEKNSEYEISFKNANELNQKIKQLKDKLTNLQINKNTKERIDNSNIELKKGYLNEISILEDLVSDKTKRLDDFNEELLKHEKELADNASKITELIEQRETNKEKTTDLEQKIVLYRNELLRVESRRDILEKQYKSYDGFYKSVQNLLKIADKDENISKKIVGVLAELIEIDEKYKQALDLALGSSLQNIVINNEIDGKYLINFIKNKNIGRITFLPINKIHGSKNNINHPKAIDTLNNLVKNDPKLDGIIDHFLSRTILVENIEDAIVVSNDIKGYRVITLDGEIINSWGSMVGGNTFKKESNSLLNRKKELDNLNDDINAIEKNIGILEKKHQVFKQEFDDTIYKLQNIDNKNNEIISKTNQIKSSIHEIEIEKSFNLKRMKEFDDLIKKIDSELISEDFSDISSLSNELSNLEKDYDLLTKENEKLKENIIDTERVIIKNQSEYDVIVRDLSISETDLDNLKIEIEAVSDSISNEEKILKLTEQNNVDSKNKIEELKVNKEKLSEEYDNNSKNYEKLFDEVKELKETIIKDNKTISNLTDSINSNEKEKYKLELKIENSEQKVVELKSDYIETYSITETELEEKLSRLDYTEASKKEVLDIKKRLSEIGYFNYESIEQFNLIAEELEFMKNQYEDLIVSRNDIIDMIKSIEKDIIEKFSSSFDMINSRFNEIFTILFNGGEAQLKLDSDDILTAGIEISARPPGKKLKNLALLSGGERALTAVALLFAIFEINPAPFCVLDEIDAALDEANIKRYITYLKTLTKHTQFIIITHRKPTMEMAERLYGVTMEEQGISKVITLAIDGYDIQN